MVPKQNNAGGYLRAACTLLGLNKNQPDLNKRFLSIYSKTNLEVLYVRKRKLYKEGEKKRNTNRYSVL
ncbi:hypothetical protein BY458DRAFT_508905 [Sporodiniella umbellata]|nr:hypothetical protein BY458DRAFT_508905 [Sporodiniella umbellata]